MAYIRVDAPYAPSSRSTPRSTLRRHITPTRALFAVLTTLLLGHYALLLTSSPLRDLSPAVDWIRARPPLPPPPPPPPPPTHQSQRPVLVGGRDPTPIASAEYFLSLAEREVTALGLDTCGDELGRSMLRGAAGRRMVYCASDHLSSAGEGVARGDEDEDALLWAASERHARVECMPLFPIPGTGGNSTPTPEWWPLASAPCVSTNLVPVARINQRNFLAPSCAVTRTGEALRKVPAEAFVGGQIVPSTEGEEGKCKRVLGHTMLFIQRMDKWNPFHAAEDMIMTLVSLLVAGTALPELAHHRIQVAFLDNFGLDDNRFHGVWDRMGALPPRRTRHDPFDDGTCLTTAIHGVYGRTSLLSASGLSGTYSCASTLTWAASHYYRHLFGLAPPPPPTGNEAVNIMYVSRGRMRHHLGELDGWQKHRELVNEGAMLARWRRGLREMCREAGCDFVDADARPETWVAAEKGKRQIRLVAIDPLVHSLETQVHLAGHATILVGQHGGALGLSLFLSPGRGAVLEFAVPMVKGNHHFQHMAAQMGHTYRLRSIEPHVNVERAWVDLRDMIEEVVGEQAGRNGTGEMAQESRAD